MKLSVRYITILFVALVMAGVSSPVWSEGSLNLSADSKDQLKTLAANTRKRTMREREAMRRARYDLLQVYSNYTIDERKAKSAQDKISAAQLNLLNIHLDNEIALRSVLNAEQFHQFRKMLSRHIGDGRMLVVVSPEEDILDKLPDKPMLDALGVPVQKQRDLRPSNPKLISDLKELSRQAMVLYGNYSLNEANCRKLIGSIHGKQKDLISLQHHRQQTIRQVLNEDQFQKLQRELAKSVAKQQHRRYRKPH
ncbi:MAG: Spy/CpxP family protein refolding chaperone [Armatimonadota bacterium]